MKRALLVLALTAAAATPAAAAPAPPHGVGTGVTYTVYASSGAGLVASCTVVADRWTADYGPTRVTAVAVAPEGISTTVRCSVTKNGTTYVDTSRTESGPVVTIVNEGNGTIPVAGIQVCVDAVSQSSVDVRPTAHACLPA